MKSFIVMVAIAVFSVVYKKLFTEINEGLIELDDC